MILPLLMGSLPPVASATFMSCEPDYWMGFWLGVMLTAIVLGIVFLLHHATKKDSP